MQPYSDYEIAQRRIAERQRKKTQFRTSVLFVAIPLLITLIDRTVGACTIPLAVIAGLLVIANGIEWYYSTPDHAPSEADIEQEMMWLFGDDWQDYANAQAYSLAHHRIHNETHRSVEVYRTSAVICSHQQHNCHCNHEKYTLYRHSHPFGHCFRLAAYFH